ncbi:glucose-6-phosphate dehydrogenase [Bradyrhizobium sp. LHD-71]|uniref:glucose-6-phosphate dehydrogenase n=1 Tax=Bradyrhizobium sp. LHD-71 TaxID=3072141 RepID=UPI00280CC24F|nr:glucose-6-phosphate dehydrogenase [Bradyrhizobium sp. LHD-71]MDQ8727572.1 glucose-6-phosphate dehydrogenase [Bradyrhizobium sp. LHD-71]
MVIFGATGDLTKRLIVPALYNLVRAKRLPEQFRLVGVSRMSQTTEDWILNLTARMNEFVAGRDCGFQVDQLDQAAWRWLTDRMTYLPGDLDDPEAYKRLGDHLASLDVKAGTGGNYLFYLAVADRLFGTAVSRLGEAGLTEENDGAWRRVVIEKPFGHDVASARALNADILKTMAEHQIYRMDHFLGKETVQNIMAIRFANGIFEPIWNRAHIDHVQITAAETVGVERRGRFYEQTGALRDMVPNHLFQLFAMTAMEPPISFDADAVRAKKAEIIQAIRPMGEAEALRNAVRGQYGAGSILGKPAAAYRHEPDVAPDSTTETFVACKLNVDNWRWAGVPFYLRTGKYMKRRRTEIAIRFRQAPYSLFRGTDVERMHPNWMILHIQPDEGVALELAAKRPGPAVVLGNVKLDFAYADYFKATCATGYETLIYDCLIGDATLFQRADNIEAGWRAVQPIIDAWAGQAVLDVPQYAAGSSGPTSADELLARDGRAWRPLG